MNPITKALRLEKKAFKFNKTMVAPARPRDLKDFTSIRTDTYYSLKKSGNEMAWNTALPSSKHKAKRERAGLPGRYK